MNEPNHRPKDDSTDSSTSAPLHSPRFPTFAKIGPQFGRWCFRLVILAFGFAVLYMLSLGPAVLLNKRGMISPETLEQMYFPLSIVSDIPGSQWFIDNYLRLWVDPDA